ncbi:MAG TPA: amidohydrolase family protein [Pyrinomonadaceae bacterium]|nr:amidohydrolase family protein [Pyrinomonadaceae bacterium]
MIKLYCASWVLPVSSAPIAGGAIAVDKDRIVAVGRNSVLRSQFPQASIRDFPASAIIPGLINAHSHLELTAMRGFLEKEEGDFFAWLKKLTVARVERMTEDDLYVSAAWGACEAARAGVTCFADASDSATTSLRALRDSGLRGIVYQESFGPDPKLVEENFEKLRQKVASLKGLETALVKCGVSPHAPYTVCGPQLELISRFAIDEALPLMMHAAETEMEVAFIREGRGPFADGLRNRGIEWQAPKTSSIRYLERHGVLAAKPLLAHCIHVDEADLELISETKSSIAHCPKSNAKLGHGIAPFTGMLKKGIAVGFGSDSMASNNNCDLLEEARFGGMIARATRQSFISAAQLLEIATAGGARSIGLQDQIGELKVGLQADFAVIALNGTHQQPSYDVWDSLIFASSGRDVTMTVVAGREVFGRGRINTLDEERLRARINEIGEKLGHR